jgi:hypothetical protein
MQLSTELLLSIAGAYRGPSKEGPTFGVHICANGTPMDNHCIPGYHPQRHPVRVAARTHEVRIAALALLTAMLGDGAESSSCP